MLIKTLETMPDGELNRRQLAAEKGLRQRIHALNLFLDDIYHDQRIVKDYPSRLLDMLQFLGPRDAETSTVALLTPGIYNSSYFEHSFLAQQMGIDLVTGRDLLVRDGYLYMRRSSCLGKCAGHGCGR